MANYLKYKVFGGYVKLKPSVVPHKFPNQTLHSTPITDIETTGNFYIIHVSSDY